MQIAGRSIIKTSLLYASFLFVLIAYIPDIIENINLYEKVRVINYFLSVGLFILTFNFKQFVYIRFIFVYSIILYIFLLETILFLGLGYNTDFNDILQLSIPFAAILIGYNINISREKYLNVIIIYCFAATILSVYSVIYYIGSFTVLDEYMDLNKNSLGAILASAASVMLCTILLKETGKNRKIRLAVYFIIICAGLLVIRARAAFISLFFCCLVLLYMFLKNKRNRYLIIGLIIFALAVLSLYDVLKVPDFIQSSLLGSRDINDLNSVSTGRIDRNVAALKFISDYPFLGQLTTYRYLEWVHNYVILKVSQYGLAGSAPLIFLYFYLIATVTKRILKIKEIRIEHFGYIAMIIPLFISLLEPSFPYGPGSVQFAVYFMLGYSFKMTSLNNLEAL
jgi:hypothetical protein